MATDESWLEQRDELLQLDFRRIVVGHRT